MKTYVLLFGNCQVIGQVSCIDFVQVNWKLWVKSSNKCMFDPIHQKLSTKDVKTIWSKWPKTIWKLKQGNFSVICMKRKPLILTRMNPKINICVHKVLPSLKPYSFIVWMTTTNNNANKWNLSLTSEQETWNRLFLSNFLKTLPLISTNYKNVYRITFCMTLFMRVRVFFIILVQKIDRTYVVWHHYCKQCLVRSVDSHI